MAADPSTDTFSVVQLLPVVGGIAAIGAVMLAHALTKRRDLRSRFIAALARERDSLEARDHSLTEEFFYWHRESVARLRGYVEAIQRHQPKRWEKLSEDWAGYEIKEGVDFPNFMFNGGDRDKLLARLDAMLSALSA